MTVWQAIGFVTIYAVGLGSIAALGYLGWVNRNGPYN